MTLSPTPAENNNSITTPLPPQVKGFILWKNTPCFGDVEGKTEAVD